MSDTVINALVQFGIALLAAIPATLYAWAAYKQGQSAANTAKIAAEKAATAAELAAEVHDIVKNGKT